MNYYVIASDGQKYGPADINTLNQWIREGRLFPGTMLEPEAGGPAVPASSVAGLAFLAQSTGYQSPTQAGAVQPTSNPSYSQSGPMQPGGTIEGGQAGGYAQYPRSFAYGAVLPEDVRKKFNWGAFLLCWIWGLNHKKPILVLALVGGFIPIVGIFVQLGLGIWAGMNGNQWAWDSGRFTSVDDMEACEVIWAKWGVGMLIFSLVACGLGVFLPMMAGLRSQ